MDARGFLNRGRGRESGMLRTLLWPVTAFLSGLGVLRAAIPLESLALMAVGLALSCFGLLRLMLREPGTLAHGPSKRSLSMRRQ